MHGIPHSLTGHNSHRPEWYPCTPVLWALSLLSVLCQTTTNQVSQIQKSLLATVGVSNIVALNRREWNEAECSSSRATNQTTPVDNTTTTNNNTKNDPSIEQCACRELQEETGKHQQSNNQPTLTMGILYRVGWLFHFMPKRTINPFSGSNSAWQLAPTPHQIMPGILLLGMAVGTHSSEQEGLSVHNKQQHSSEQEGLSVHNKQQQQQH